ncbi:MAG TPA: helix-turn-helix transcriptional regulator [Streptosporangiaceae bacterium]|nr:helix-turn-helix transcriptional regulator [Streptosporangiaceae bacterium]
MAARGRPVERPAHLSPEQRRRAQFQTKQWREQCELSQREMAAEIHVSLPSYRPWESGRDDHAGPTRLQAEQLDKALRRLLGSRYGEGEAFDLWGWPRQRDMSYDRVVQLLRSVEFDVPRLQPNGQPPAGVFWVHRAREPNLVHGVFSLAAAAATRAGLPVHLLLDDIAVNDRRNHDLCDELDSKIRTWVAFASGDDAKLSTKLYSEVLTEPYVTERGWPAITDYLNPRIGVLDFLVASKVISPLQYTINAEESVQALLRNAESLGAERLLTPLRNWLVFEKEISSILEHSPGGMSDFVVTLGGEDERTLWNAFHRGCSDELSSRVRHTYLRPLPMPSYRSPWQERALSAGTNRSTLTTYLVNRTPSDRADLLEWLLKTAVRLPASLNPGFGEGLDPVLGDVDALLRTPASELPPATVGAIAKAVVEWLNV